MLKVYTGEISDYAYLPVLYPNLGIQTKDKSLFIGRAFKNFISPVFELVKDPQQADFFLFPYDYFLTSNQPEQAVKLAALAAEHGKKIIIFGHGDSDEEIPISNAVIFRTSQYRYKKKPNEIIMPAYAEDLAGENGIILRHKIDKPIISFCGWAEFKNPKEKLVFYTKQVVADLKNLLSGEPIRVRRRGLWFRKKVIESLRASSLVENQFIIRKSFSGHKATIDAPVEKLRREYIDNINNSDFVLSVKGYGNFSLRFYEALSLGRIPLLVDTDCILPLEDRIKYQEFILPVDYKKIDKADRVVEDLYRSLSEEDFVAMQKKARENFQKYLKIDSFFKLIPDLLRPYYHESRRE